MESKIVENDRYKEEEDKFKEIFHEGGELLR